MNVRIVRPPRFADARGWLLKAVEQAEVPAGAAFGEIYLTRTEPGARRGGHYHEKTTEWFCPVAGRARLLLLDRATGERRDVALDEADPVLAVLPAGLAHAVVNDGDAPFHLLSYADRPYDPADRDTFPAAF